MVAWKAMYFRLSLLYFSCNFTPLRISWPCLYIIPSDIMHTAELSLPHNEQSQISSFPSLTCFSPLIIFLVLHWIHSIPHVSILYWGDQNCIQHSKCGSPVPHWYQPSPPLICWRCSSNAAQDFVGFLCLQGTLLVVNLMLNLLSTRTPGFFSANSLSRW